VGLLGARTVLRHEVWTNDETLFRSVLAERPGDLTARLNLAEFCLKVGDLEGAEREYGYVALVEPRNALAQFQLGKAAYDRGELDAAQRHLEAAAAAGTMADPHFVLAQTFEAKGMKQEAARHYRTFIRMAESGFEVPYGAVAAAKIRLHVIEVAAAP
jgi:tetratricopeptide (TPR) repeat protein